MADRVPVIAPLKIQAAGRLLMARIIQKSSIQGKKTHILYMADDICRQASERFAEADTWLITGERKGVTHRENCSLDPEDSSARPVAAAPLSFFFEASFFAARFVLSATAFRSVIRPLMMCRGAFTERTWRPRRFRDSRSLERTVALLPSGRDEGRRAVKHKEK
jgi:hypothetical protein